MRLFDYITLDVFTDQRFGGNQLAVFPAASGLADAEMQRISSEMNFSETTFVFPPANVANTASVRILNRTAEMPFAGHPNVGTGFALGALAHPSCAKLLFEEKAGLVEVRLDRGDRGEIIGAEIDAPQPLAVIGEIPVNHVANALSLKADSVHLMTHAPTRASVGVEFLLVELVPGELARCVPDLSAFKVAAANEEALVKRLSIFAYEWAGVEIRARMFSPLAGTWEDAATGSASATLAALILRLRPGAETASVVIHQGEFMGRPSVLQARAWRADGEIRAAVRGRCVPVCRGTLELD